MDAPYQLLPPLLYDEYESLKADIAERGVLVAIEFDEDGNVLDGHHRLQIAHELGIEDYPTVIRSGWTEAQKRSHARSLNVHRRHLNQEQRRLLIAQELLENPSASNNSVAKRLGVSDMTVASVRNTLGDAAQSEFVTGADGKLYPAKRTETPIWNSGTPELHTAFLDDFRAANTPIAENAELLLEDKPSDDFFTVAWTLGADDRRIVVDAIQMAKRRHGKRLAVEGLVEMCRDILAFYESGINSSDLEQIQKSVI